MDKIEEQQQARRIKREQLDTFITTLLRQDSFLMEFDEDLWIAVIVQAGKNRRTTTSQPDKAGTTGYFSYRIVAAGFCSHRV
ncbi:hypothetical protein [Desulfosporosinus sp. Sb-LF]|uniref:hypothetical protein n=1 Tax=Desulfosporosinus sp. Sb-LF TaxID=2560027 RepID=UPI00107FCD21|nr:hypothetical protein [Desulfosporosinus sp. Sb-LF]TGE33884.1 hypothetical protein E4K68_03485 [Desulfosporosinus sp. Sb-LF]